jgi:glycosyltransferase involved in cell wall biosynthesis
MKILHIYKDFYPPIVGGIETHMHTLVQATRDRCEKIEVLISNRRFRNETVEVEGVEVFKVADMGRVLSTPLSPGFPLALARHPADIYHYHVPNPTAEISHLMVRPRGKMIVSYHSDVVRQSRSYKIYSHLQRRFLKRADRIIVFSPNYLQSSKTLQPFKDNCEIIPYGIELNHFEATNEVQVIAERIRRRYTGKRVLFVGRLCYYKGLEVLLEAIASVDAHLMVVGSGPMTSHYLRQHQNLPYRDRIHFIGQVDSVVPYYYAADVFCLPSIYRSEAFGIVQLEAGACGLPLVSTNLDSGVPYVNQDGHTGIVVPTGNAVALAEALNRLLGDEELRQRMGKAARKRVENEFSAQLMGERVIDLYQRVLEGEKA